MKSRGFTIIELVVVAGIMGLLIVSLVTLRGLKENRYDKIKLGFFQDVVLSLQEYRDVCRFYPPSLSEGVSGCSVQLSDVLPDSPNEKVVALNDIDYVLLRKAGAGSSDCYVVHMGIGLNDEGFLHSDDDFYAFSSAEYDVCAGYTDFDGSAEDDSGGIYDVLLGGEF